MRCVAVVLLIVLACGRAHAQVQAPPPEPPPGPEPAPYAVPYGQPGYGYAPAEAMYRSGRRQRTVGIVLTSVGIGLAVVTGLLVYDATRQSNSVDKVVEEFFAIFTGVAGLGCIIPGAILWAHGEDKMDQARQLGAGDFSFLPQPATSFALGATFRLRF